MYLESGRDSLVHLEILLSTVESTVVLTVEDLPGGEVPDAVAETGLAQLVVVGHEVPEGLDLLHLCLLLGVHDTDQGLILWNSGYVMRVCGLV